MKTSRCRYRTSLAGFILALLLAVSTHAATITVTSTADAGGTCPGASCTLRQAIATAVSGIDTINFSLPANSAITLTSALPAISKFLTINGPGANLLTVQRAPGTPAFGIFVIIGNFQVTISGLTIANGMGAFGGGIENVDGVVTITNCTISGNSATDSGGGIANIGNGGGSMTVINSTISGNAANVGGNASGGGIYNLHLLTITNSIISGNAAFTGAGIYRSSGTVTITNSTISGNPAGSNGGGIYRVNSGTFNVKNTIIAQNTVPAGGGGPDLFGAFTSQGYNLIGTYSGSTGFTNGVNNDQVGGNPNPNLNPMLGPLQNNGGPTFTHALLSNSTAIDKGHSSGSVTDQRGFTRPVDSNLIVNPGDGSDIGAYEVQADQLPGCNTIVQNNNDSGSDSLRAIIANACPGSTITFAPNVTGAINLTSGELVLNKNLTISGPGANLLSVQRHAAAGNFRIFRIAPASVIANISGLTIANGNTNDGGAGNGGGIFSLGRLTLTNATVSGNTARFSSAGGILNSSGTLTIINSTISGNSATGSFGGGGGIWNFSGTLTLINSTISGNSATDEFFGNDAFGGGIYNSNGGTVILTNSTISGNTAQLQGGGIRNSNGTVRARNTIIALNTSANGPDINGALASENFNLIGNGSPPAMITPLQFSDQIGTAGSPINPKLGPLQNNGGPTLTHALLSGSRAIDKGTSNGLTGVLTTDQRGVGYARQIDNSAIANATGGDGTDIGAFEFGARINAVSRKTHGSAGLFDIKLPLTGPTLGVECRKGGSSHIFKVIVTFPSAVTVAKATVTPDPAAAGATGRVSRFSVSGSKVTVNLTGVSNAQTILINLLKVSDGTNQNNVTVPMGVLLGDTDKTGSVTSADVTLTQSKSGQPVSATNSREDVTLDGAINGTDVNLVQSKVGTGLP